jgi:hypothetical protein
MCPSFLPFHRANPVNTLSALRSITNASREKRINTSKKKEKKWQTGNPNLRLNFK